MAVEQHGEKSEKIVSLDCGDEAAQAAALLGRKWFRGKNMNDHGIKTQQGRVEWYHGAGTFS